MGYRFIFLLFFIWITDLNTGLPLIQQPQAKKASGSLLPKKSPIKHHVKPVSENQNCPDNEKGKNLHFQNITQWKLFPLIVLFNSLQQYIRYFSVQMPGEYVFLADLAAGNSGTN